MSDCQREMTLDEWVGQLYPTHRAVRELAELRAELERVKGRYDALNQRVRKQAHQWEQHPHMPLDMGTAARCLRSVVDGAGGNET